MRHEQKLVYERNYYVPSSKKTERKEKDEQERENGLFGILG